MQGQKKSLLTKFLVWRLKHIPNKQFVYLLSIIVGILSGIGAVAIKNFTYFIQEVLEGNLIEKYHSAFYFIFPLIGLLIVYFILTYIFRNKITQGIPATLFAISKKKGFIERYKMLASVIFQILGALLPVTPETQAVVVVANVHTSLVKET